MEKVLAGADGVYALALTDSELDIMGVFLLSNSGLLLHCLPFAGQHSMNAKNTCKLAMKLLSPFFTEHEVFCVSGEYYGTIFMQNAIRFANVQTVLESHAYYRMEYDEDKDTIAKKEKEEEEKQEKVRIKEEREDAYGFSEDDKRIMKRHDNLKNNSELESDLEIEENNKEKEADSGAIVKCSEADAEELAPLQASYDKVEVLLKGMTEDKKTALLQIKKRLRNQSVYAVILSGKYVAMAATNADGKNWLQIGGVYTIPLYRKRGMASRLVSRIARNNMAQGRQTTLFVKEINTLAIHSYQRAGFVKKGNYRITYYS
ncbi:MAG: GNAT family N-acetyltransferase [Treponema sp.]|nr:GNAT family N-acetyltransferase [Treponema sp.]